MRQTLKHQHTHDLCRRFLLEHGHAPEQEGVIDRLAHTEASRRPVDGVNSKRLPFQSNAISRIAFVFSAHFQLCLKSFNKTRSAYGIFLFAGDFFSDYDTKCLSSDTAKDCRLSMKAALSMFKSAYFVWKRNLSVMYAHCGYSWSVNCKLIFQHTCDVSRSFDVNVMEKHKPFTSDVSKSDLRNAVTIAAFLNEMHTGYEELMMSAHSDKIVFKNFVQIPVERNNATPCRTEITVQKACFKRFSLQRTTEISFCMKEFKVSHSDTLKSV
ncbi:Rad9 [Ostertagia ostertagi]